MSWPAFCCSFLPMPNARRTRRFNVLLRGSTCVYADDSVYLCIAAATLDCDLLLLVLRSFSHCWIHLLLPMFHLLAHPAAPIHSVLEMHIVTPVFLCCKKS